ncbi:hypothetical protein EHW67_19535 [Arenibacter aquaticus]|uniref:ASPIC/UnbV domain-containing protein n=2 Tax=Arenibacter aquaticus TaxID=2489054 RepID=A0A3S0C563_9FLAO|nr:hypothetical protein EHW67_19535 [Arenibacter aquaticus]
MGFCCIYKLYIHPMKKTLLILSILLASCQHKKSEVKELPTRNEALYTVLESETTGINFSNELKENTYMNGLFYEYYYNGAGVAVADFNNDDLADIYFISSLSENQLYLNKGDMQFQNVSKAANAGGGYGFGTGVTVVDINNDGLMDIYYCKSGKISDPDKRRNELLINKGVNAQGTPVFKNEAHNYGLDFPDFTTQATFFDYDKDGDLDLFVINHGIELYDENVMEDLIHQKSEFRGERLFRNDNGKYVNVSDEAGIINSLLGFGLGISVGDLNNDGWPDVYVGNDFSEKDHLYINNKNGSFREVSLDAFGHVSNFSMGNDIADINNDGLLDIMTVDMMAEDNYTQKTSMSGMNPAKFYKHVNLGLHNQYMYNALQLNSGINKESGNPQFSDIAPIAGVTSTDWSWAPLFFDMDNDGKKDLFVSNGIKRDFRNNDFVNYRKKKQAEVIANKEIQTESYIADLLSKMPTREKENYFFLNNGADLKYIKQDIFQPLSNSNGAAYADFDNDGDLDIVVNNSSSSSFIYRNNSSNNNYVGLKLQGTANNVDALGARVILWSKSGNQYLEHYYTRGFQSAMAHNLHFGIGQDKKVDSIVVVWPNSTYEVFVDVPINKTVTLAYNKEKVAPYNYSTSSEGIFTNITKASKINFSHKENDFNDFSEETLLPHRMSQLGPALAVADVNNDGLDDFFIGGAKDQASQLFFQDSEGKFRATTRPFAKDSKHEDVGAIFFDADNDGDLDLYVISGGSEKTPNDQYYLDRLYVNDGEGKFLKSATALPNVVNSGLRAAVADYDQDGDLDLFVGGRVLPGSYGRLTKSYLLENQSANGILKFTDVTNSSIPEMIDHTMVTAATWHDFNGDNYPDLLVANEWGPIELFVNEGGILQNMTKDYGLDKNIGWWSSLTLEDIDDDGDMDIIAGNLGLNYKYKASFKAPFYMYINDFDDNKKEDIVLGYQQDSTVYPVRGRQCSSEQMPFIKEKFKTYNDFGSATINEIYGDKLKQGISYEATDFSTSILYNQGGNFSFSPLPNRVQLSSVNSILVDDYNKDKQRDILLLGNLYGSEVETPRNDASYGFLLLGTNGKEFNYLANQKANLWAKGDIKDAANINLASGKGILFARNNGELSLIRVN